MTTDILLQEVVLGKIKFKLSAAQDIIGYLAYTFNYLSRFITFDKCIHREFTVLLIFSDKKIYGIDHYTQMTDGGVKAYL